MALPLRIAMTLAGIGLALMGSLTAVTFWRSRITRVARVLPQIRPAG